jgi:hypothetical protein
MGYDCAILVDSLSPAGARLTTFQVTFPRFILAEWNTHRVLSRNAASSRAIPVARRLQSIANDPVYPVEWGVNRRGMQATDVLPAVIEDEARRIWHRAMEEAVIAAAALDSLTPSVHKQIANRVAEAYAWVDVVASATEWEGFFAQRAHPDAQPEFRVIAHMMRETYRASEPIRRTWHLPYVDDAALDWQQQHWRGLDHDALFQISTGRCARVSYKTFDGRTDPTEDIRLHGDLAAASPPHASPFEHPAEALSDPDVFCGNFRGWCQYRHRRLGGRHLKEVA